jgi:hypothetical protein
MIVRFVLSVLVICTSGFAQSKAGAVDHLRGNPTVGLLPVICDPKLSELGLTSDVLGRDIELILRRSGVPIVENNKASGIFLLTVDVTPIDLSTGKNVGSSFLVAAHFAEMATVVRTGDLFMADVWSRPLNVVCERGQISMVRDSVRDAAESFALEYLRSNPPQQQPQGNRP